MTDTANDATIRLMRELDRLRSENRELREEAEVLEDDYEQMRGYYDEADGEKARLEVMVRMHGHLIDKLRELCAELMRNAQVAANVGVNVGKLAGWERRAGELGVEVEG